MLARTTSCCGLQELTGVSGHEGAEAALKALISYSRGTIPHCSHLIFTGVTGRSKTGDDSYGGKLEAYIREKGLGTVTGSQIATNPNSHRRLKVWIWTLDRKAFSSWSRQVWEEQQTAQQAQRAADLAAREKLMAKKAKVKEEV